MVISDVGYGVISLATFLIASLKIAREWARYGIFKQSSVITVVGCAVLALGSIVCYGGICLISPQDIYGELFLYMLISCALPLIWFLLYRFWILPSWIGFDYLFQKIIDWEKKYLVPGERISINEQIFQNLSSVDRVLNQLLDMVEFNQRGKKIKRILCQEAALPRYGIKPNGCYSIDCITPKCKGKVDLRSALDEDDCDCDCCGAHLKLTRLYDDRVKVRAELKPIIKLTQRQCYVVAIGSELIARLYRMLGDIDSARLYLDQADEMVQALHQEQPNNYEYIELLGDISFGLGEINHVCGDLRLAAHYYLTSRTFYCHIGNKSYQMIDDLIVQLN